MTELILPNNPVEIAIPFAADIVIAAAVEDEDVQEASLVKAVNDLHHVAALSGMINKQYLVDARGGLLIPSDAEQDDTIEAQVLEKTIFEGRFIYYEAVRRRVGRSTVRSLLYLAFDNAITVPYSSRLEHSPMVHVSAFDVEQIHRLSA